MTLLMYLLWLLPPPLLRLQLRQLGFHLRDEHLQLFLTLLAGVGVDVAGMLLPVDPPGRVAPLVEMIIDLADASGARPAPAGQNGLKSGHTRRFALAAGNFPVPASDRPPAALFCRYLGRYCQRPCAAYRQ